MSVSAPLRITHHQSALTTHRPYDGLLLALPAPRPVLRSPFAPLGVTCAKSKSSITCSSFPTTTSLQVDQTTRDRQDGWR